MPNVTGAQSALHGNGYSVSTANTSIKNDLINLAMYTHRASPTPTPEYTSPSLPQGKVFPVPPKARSGRGRSGTTVKTSPILDCYTSDALVVEGRRPISSRSSTSPQDIYFPSLTTQYSPPIIPSPENGGFPSELHDEDWETIIAAPTVNMVGSQHHGNVVDNDKEALHKQSPAGNMGAAHVDDEDWEIL